MMSKGQPVGLWIMYWNYQVNWRRFISEAAGFMVNHIPNPKFFSSLLRKSHLEPNHEKVPGLFKAGLNLCATFCPLGPSLTIVSSTQHNTVSLVPATKARQNYSELLFHAYLVCELLFHTFAWPSGRVKRQCRYLSYIPIGIKLQCSSRHIDYLSEVRTR